MAKCPISRLFIYLFIKRWEYERMLENNSQFRAFLHTHTHKKIKIQVQNAGGRNSGKIYIELLLLMYRLFCPL